MQKAIDQYIEKVHAEQRPPAICGLALHLGFNSRQSLLNYEGYSDEFLDIIKKAKTQIEMYHEEQLSGRNPTGHIFWLKNFKWKDTKDINAGGSVNIILERE